MSLPGQDLRAQEIIIVRRRDGADSEGHHGGVWKIAYADFMTAMMAFFLVMWLVNSTDKKTLTQVANYFNPIKLTDKTPDQKGLQNPTAQASRTHEGQIDFPQGKIGEKAHNPETQDEEALLRNPLAALAEIAKLAPQNDKPPGNPAHDPFAQPAPRLAADLPAAALAEPAAEPADTKTRTAAQNDGEAQAQLPQQPEAVKRFSAAGPDTNRAEALQAGLFESLKKLPAHEKPQIRIETVAESVLITLSDAPAFEMFAIGSAEPNPKLVAFMSQFAGILREYPGQIVIRGHTDARVYDAGGISGNWRLSANRALMGGFMLMRGGLQETRISHIEGHADRSLADPGDPLSGENRRIEILLRKE